MYLIQETHWANKSKVRAGAGITVDMARRISSTVVLYVVI